MTASQIARRRRGTRRRHSKNNGNGRRNALRGILVAVAAFGVLGLVAVGGVLLYAIQRYDSYASGVVPPEQLLAQLPRGGARIYDRNGTLLYEFVDEFGGLRRPVPLSEISNWVKLATIATEDASFYTNNGLNSRGLARATWENFAPFGGDPFEGSGGSSITQQLAKNVYIPKEERTQRSVDRKLRETVIALELTKRYSKDQILEWYLNSISYGGIYVGIQAAAEGYFGKPAKDLTLAEGSLLAGIPQSPFRYEPVQNFENSKGRQREVLDLMVRHGAIEQDEADRAHAEELAFHQSRFAIDSPHFVLGPVAKELEARFGARALYEDGLEVVTTLDTRLQRLAEQTLEKWIAEFEKPSNVHNGALMAIDPKTGQVLTYVGSRDYFRDDIHGRNDNIQGLNSPGSTLKPFTYISAFQQGWSTATAIIDSPAKVTDPSTGQPFSPRNPNGQYNGIVTTASALGNSLNVPAFKTILYAGVDNVVNLLKQSGITTLNDSRGYGPALTLGGVDIRLDDLTYAYTLLPNDGVMRGQQPVVPHRSGERTVDPAVLLKVTNADKKVLWEYKQPVERRVFAPAYSYLVTSIMSDAKNTCITFGCTSLSLSGRPSAAKTGTSEPFENSRAIGETWTFGYTPDLVSGIWAGNADNAPVQNIVSTSISWRAWNEFMLEAHKILELQPRPFARPQGVEEREVCFPSGKLPTDACPRDRRSRGLFASETLSDREKVARATDTWWQRTQIDVRTGQLALPGTPRHFIAEEVRLVFPKEELDAWPGLREWAVAQGLGGSLTPTAQTSIEASTFANITSPAQGQRVSGQVSVTGRASSPDFQRYVLEWGSGQSPSNWVQITNNLSPVGSGSLGAWDTSQLPPGDYTLRLRVTDSRRGDVWSTVHLTVGGAGAQPRPGGAQPPGRPVSEPVAVISTPTDGALITGPTAITGTATAGQLLDFTLEVGQGLTPTSWTTIRRDSNPVGGGTLGTWNPTGLPNGVYIIRLTVRDRSLGASERAVLVSLMHRQ